MATRGLILAAKARLDAAKADVRAAEGARRPQVYGVAMADTANQTANRGASVGITVSLPIFEDGSVQAEIGRVRAMRDRALADVRRVEIEVEREVREAYVDLGTAEANVTSARSSVEATTAAYQVATLRVSSGKGILVEQLDALQMLSQARADLAQALYGRRIAHARILRATGSILGQGAAR